MRTVVTLGRALLGLLTLACALACSRPTVPPAAPQAPQAGEADASPAPVDAGEAIPGQAEEASSAPDAASGLPGVAPLGAAVAVVGGEEVPLPKDGSAVVDPAAAFRVDVAAQLTDGRLALHDEQDAMVSSSGTSEVGPGATRYRLVPDEPLRPGSVYLLRVDGTASREVHDPAGRAYAPIEIRLRTSGERPAAPPRKRKKGGRSGGHRHPPSEGP